MKKKIKVKPIWNPLNQQDWIKNKSVSSELRQQMEEMSSEELKVAFEKKPLAFGTAGIRAKMGPGIQYLNKYTYRQIMVGYCKYILAKKHKRPAIMIAHDNRANSDKFALVCAEVARQMGITVYIPQENRVLPTPILSYAIRKNKLHGGVNITASHNPKEDNGFKAYNGLGAQVLPNEAEVIIRNMPQSQEIFDLSAYWKKGKPAEMVYLNYKELVDSFFEEVIKATVLDKRILTPRAPIKKVPIVFTGFHGTTTKLMPRFLDRLGFKKVYVYPAHNSISGAFENCPISNPEDPKAFDDVIKYANKVKSTIVIGCDPDGDRVAFGFKKTNRWRFLTGNEMGIIFSHYILNRKRFTEKKPLIITTHVSTSYVDKIAAKTGATVMRTKTGFKWLSNMIDRLSDRYEFILGFEEAIGALVHNVCRDKDCFGAVMLALEALNRGNPYFPDLHDYLCDRIYDIYSPTYSHTFSFTVKSKDWKNDAKKMMHRALHTQNRDLFDYKIEKVWYQKEGDCVVWTLDKDSWIKFRVSGTEPKFKVYFNFNNEMAGQLKAAAVMNISKIEQSILKGFTYTK
ncbi:MAG: phospho-sugar mutase [Mycoplasma sp.]|nr:phospho-sugar mutase [Candidatus Hennigella equi]